METETIEVPAVDFTALADQMRGWEDVCGAVSADDAVSPFEAGPDEFQPTVTSESERLGCYVGIDLERRGKGNFIVWVDIFDTNVEAAEKYAHHQPYITERFHVVEDGEPDLAIELGEESPWSQGKVTAFEEPTDSSSTRRGAYAVVQGDFYVFTISMWFHPEDTLKAGCQPSPSVDCLMTATEYAQFMVDDYLDTAYQSIETKLGRL